MYCDNVTLGIFKRMVGFEEATSTNVVFLSPVNDLVVHYLDRDDVHWCWDYH